MTSQLPWRELGSPLDSTWSAERERILDRYLTLLSESNNPLAHAEGMVSAQLTAQLYGVVDTVAAVVGIVATTTGEEHPVTNELSADIGRDRAKSAIHPSHSLHAASLIFDAALPSLIERTATAEATQLVGIASALNREILNRMGAAARTYVEHLFTASANANRDERRRLSRELHDVAAPAVALSLHSLEIHDRLLQSEPALASKSLDTARAAMSDAMTTIRSLASQTRAAVAADGLVLAIEQLLVSVPGSIITAIHVDEDACCELPLAFAEEAFLIVREAIRNAVAHAQPSSILVNVSTRAARVVVSVTDDGIGFDPGLSHDRACCIGIAAMHERAELLGAELIIRSAPKVGSTVELGIPLPTTRQPSPS